MEKLSPLIYDDFLNKDDEKKQKVINRAIYTTSILVCNVIGFSEFVDKHTPVEVINILLFN